LIAASSRARPGTTPKRTTKSTKCRRLRAMPPRARLTPSLSFRQNVSAPIFTNYPAMAFTGSVQAVLEGMNTIRNVTVSFSGGASRFCVPGTTVVTSITFVSEHGPIPLLTIVDNNVAGSVTVARPTPGTKDSIECNRRGYCGESVCVCVCEGCRELVPQRCCAQIARLVSASVRHSTARAMVMATMARLGIVASSTRCGSTPSRSQTLWYPTACRTTDVCSHVGVPISWRVIFTRGPSQVIKDNFFRACMHNSRTSKVRYAARTQALQTKRCYTTNTLVRTACATDQRSVRAVP
jgi:hypothetical protein